MLLLLYITLDGCGWNSPFSLAAPVMVISRQLNSNDSGGGGGEGKAKLAIMFSIIMYS